MATLNEPILLNSTGLTLLNELKKKTGYLAVIAEGEKGQIYQSMEQIARLVRSNSVEANKKMFPIGDQIIMPWKNMDSSAHDTDATAYQVAWDIVHHSLVTLKDGSVVPGMYLQMHACTAYGVQFSHPQAFYQAAASLPAGTYYIKFGVKFSATFPANSYGHFTLTSALPAGGRLTLSGTTVSVWETAESASASYTATMSTGQSGTNLGTISSAYAVSSDGLNAANRIASGHCRWSTSAMRQYLNSEGLNWFSSKETFDIRPEEYAKHGFLSGFNSDFLNAIKPIKVTTMLPTVGGYESESEDTYDLFCMPASNEMFITTSIPEADTFEYWPLALQRSTPVGSGSSNKNSALYFKDLTGASAECRLRSAILSDVCTTRYVAAQGYVTSTYNVDKSYHTKPVCCVC